MMNKEELETIIRDAFKAGILMGDHLAKNNYFDAPLEDNEMFDVKISHAKELGLIP